MSKLPLREPVDLAPRFRKGATTLLEESTSVDPLWISSFDSPEVLLESLS